MLQHNIVNNVYVFSSSTSFKATVRAWTGDIFDTTVPLQNSVSNDALHTSMNVNSIMMTCMLLDVHNVDV